MCRGWRRRRQTRVRSRERPSASRAASPASKPRHAEVVRQVHRRHRHHRRVHRRQGFRGQHRHEGPGRRRPRHRDRSAAGPAADAGRAPARSVEAPEGRRGQRRRELVARLEGCTARSTTSFYAAPMLANLKGYVWYSPAQFEEWGVEVPTTWDELLTLTQTIQETTGAAPVVRRLLLRGGIRLAGHRLDRGPRPASGRPGGLRRVGRQRGQVHRPRDRGRVRRGRRDPAEPGVRQRRLRRREEHQLHGVRRRRRRGRRPALRADAPGVVPVGELPRRSRPRRARCRPSLPTATSTRSSSRASRRASRRRGRRRVRHRVLGRRRHGGSAGVHVHAGVGRRARRASAGPSRPTSTPTRPRLQRVPHRGHGDRCRTRTPCSASTPPT